jgi:hypothetical protein
MEKNSKIVAEISPGELLDKIGILEIKIDKIKNKDKQIEINKEYNTLKRTQDQNIDITNDLSDLIKKLKEVNLNLWVIEDKLRVLEKNKDYGKTFVDLARNVYINNDKRAAIKLKINTLLKSNIKEVKEYVSY